MTHVPGIQDERDEWGYGYFHLDDPRDFFPDPECCSPVEIAAHTEACRKAERGEDWGPRSETHGPWTNPQQPGTVVIGEKPGDGWIGACHAVRSFGIGTYLLHEDGGDD